MIVTACYNDTIDSTITQENSYAESVEIVPIPGNSGMIQTSSITSDSLQLAWTAATDEKTPQAELEYRVYRAASSVIRTPDDAELNGTPLSDWTADASSMDVTGLESGRVHYFNVIVRAQDGRKAAYVMVSATTVGVVYLYSADGTHTGNLTTPYTSSARADVDSICAPIPVSGPLTAHAFISIGANDAIKDFPARYGAPSSWPVKSVSGNQIAWNWADMLDGSINMKLEAAGVASTFWWSGSTTEGGFDTENNCSGWTEGTNKAQGMEGAHNLISEEWLARDARNCNNALKILCVAW
ncbi:MAG: hypothetical protein KBA61_07810 [Spirochaetes bacterium]|nr:hypothetical protein [Spirochaetota bacterium]